MSSAKQKYLAGRIFRAIDRHFGPLTPTAYADCSRNPQLMPTLLRHVWEKAAAHPDLSKIVPSFDPAAAAGPDLGEFHLGYYQEGGVPAGHLSAAQVAGRLDVGERRAQQLLAEHPDALRIGRELFLPEASADSLRERPTAAGWPKGKPRKVE